jgi:hypothetical protein
MKLDWLSRRSVPGSPAESRSPARPSAFEDLARRRPARLVNSPEPRPTRPPLVAAYPSWSEEGADGAHSRRAVLACLLPRRCSSARSAWSPEARVVGSRWSDPVPSSVSSSRTGAPVLPDDDRAERLARLNRRRETTRPGGRAARRPRRPSRELGYGPVTARSLSPSCSPSPPPDGGSLIAPRFSDGWRRWSKSAALTPVVPASILSASRRSGEPYLPR